MDWVWRVAVILVTAWLQTGFFGHVRPLGVMPNLMLVLVILSGLLDRATPTLLAAVLGGLMLDLASGTDFGLRMAFYAAVALAVIAIRQLGVHGELLLPVAALVAVATLIFDAAVLASAGLLASLVAVAVRIGAEMLVNVTMAIIIQIFILLRQRRRPTILEVGV